MTDSIIPTSHGNIHVTVKGEGPTIVLIHGNSSSSRAFKNQFTAVSPGGALENHRLIAFDLPGHGQSAKATDPYATYCLPGYADMSLQVLKSLNVDNYVVFGWSLGGHVALEMLDQSDQLKGVIICGTPPVGVNAEDLARAFIPSEEAPLNYKPEFTPEEAHKFTLDCYTADYLTEDLVDDTIKCDGQSRSHLAVSIGEGRAKNQLRVAETSAKPIAVFHGPDDPFISGPYFASVKFANLWRDEICLFDGQGHAPFFGAPEKANPLIAAFARDCLA